MTEKYIKPSLKKTFAIFDLDPLRFIASLVTVITTTIASNMSGTIQYAVVRGCIPVEIQPCSSLPRPGGNSTGT